MFLINNKTLWTKKNRVILTQKSDKNLQLNI